MDKHALKTNFVNTHFQQFEPGLKEFLIQHATITTFDSGEVIMRNGQYIKTTVMVVEGRVKLYREGEDGGEFFMYYLEPGNACALSMICATKQETSEIMAQAIVPTTVLTVPIGLMDEMMKQYKTWYYFVLETYRTRYEELLTVIDHIAFKNMDERLLNYLTTQYKKSHTRELRFTHQEIATDLHSSREVISRLLKKMEQRGDLVLHRNFIEWLR